MAKFYAVADRPVKIVQAPDGGSDALVFDMATGGFVPDRAYLARTADHGKEVAQLAEEDFDKMVAELRHGISLKRKATPIRWDHTGDGKVPYRAKVGDKTFTIRVNDFPAEPLYTLMWEGQELESLDDWPMTWKKPPTPQELIDMAKKTFKP